MNIPHSIKNCPDPELKTRAISIFNRGTDKEKTEVLNEVLLKTRNKSQAGEKQIKVFKEWIRYFNHQD